MNLFLASCSTLEPSIFPICSDLWCCRGKSRGSHPQIYQKGNHGAENAHFKWEPKYIITVFIYLAQKMTFVITLTQKRFMVNNWASTIWKLKQNRKSSSFSHWDYDGNGRVWFSHFVLMTVLSACDKDDPRNVHLIGSQLVTLELIKELKILRTVLSYRLPTEHKSLYTLP